MAVVNVDLSEYDAIRKRNSELEEQVKELKKLNDSLKNGSKVIIRKETVVEYNEIEENPYRQVRGIGGLYKPRNVRRTIESSEFFVNFEDVHFKVEQAMQDEVNRSIQDRNLEKQAYAEKKNKLDNEYNGRKADLKKVYEKKAKDLEEDYSRKEIELRNKYSTMVTNFESEKLRILNLLPNIRKLAEELHDDLNNRFFKPKHAIELANSIINSTIKKW